MDNENENINYQQPNFILVEDIEPEVEFVLHKDQQGDDLKEPIAPKENYVNTKAAAGNAGNDYRASTSGSGNGASNEYRASAADNAGNAEWASNAGYAYDEANADNAQKAKRPKKPKKERGDSPYVTRRFMIIALVITMVLSSAIGACIAIIVGNNSSSYQNLNYDNLATATGSEMSVQEIIALNEDAVVEILTETTSTNYFGQSTLSQGAGSGVIVNSDGYIVTNNHVISGANSVQVTLHNGKEYSATVVGADSDNDVAVLKIAAKGLTAATLGDSTKLAVGDLAVAIGNPLGSLGGSATAGIISSLERRLTLNNTTLDLLQTDASINPGNSGGGLFNQKGELVGIVVAKGTGDDVEGLGFAIPISNVAEIIDDLIQNGTVSSKPAIGIVIYDVTSSNNGMEAGTYIQSVTGSQAKQAGLKEGDRVISINGNEISSRSDLTSRVRKCKIGDTVTLVIERNGEEMTIKTVLEDSSAVSG